MFLLKVNVIDKTFIKEIWVQKRHIYSFFTILRIFLKHPSQCLLPSHSRLPWGIISEKFNEHIWINAGKVVLGQKVSHFRDVPRMIFIPVYRYGRPKSGAQKRKYIFLYNVLLQAIIQVRKHTLLIVNHFKTWETPAIGDHQHFNIELLGGS